MFGTSNISSVHFNPSDCCGCPGCCHVVTGVGASGSSDVFEQNLPVMRGCIDMGTHCCCCGPNIWGPMTGDSTVKVNNASWARLTDMNWCCGGTGNFISGSAKTFSGGGQG